VVAGAGEGDAQLKGKVNDLLNHGTTHVMLNMVDVTYVDSSGLGALVGVSLSARHHGGGVTLVTPSKRLMELLTVARLRRGQRLRHGVAALREPGPARVACQGRGRAPHIHLAAPLAPGPEGRRRVTVGR
jgi:anti-sigma B factor antagonist